MRHKDNFAAQAQDTFDTVTQRKHLMDKQSKAMTPGYKAVLIGEATFKELQKLQQLGGKPSRLSVADLADAAITLQLSSPSLILDQARKTVINSLSNSRKQA